MPQKCEHSHWSFGHINPNRAGLVDVALEWGGKGLSYINLKYVVTETT